MQQGKDYENSLGDGNSAMFVFDLKNSFSRGVNVDQLGYLMDLEHERAYLGAYLCRFSSLGLPGGWKFLDGVWRLANKSQKPVDGNSQEQIALAGLLQFVKGCRCATTTIGQGLAQMAHRRCE